MNPFRKSQPRRLLRMDSDAKVRHIVGHCSRCGRLLYPAQPMPTSYEEDVVIGICVRCVCLALCKMTITLWGNLGDHPRSDVHRGHDQRIHDHVQRLQYIKKGCMSA